MGATSRENVATCGAWPLRSTTTTASAAYTAPNAQADLAGIFERTADGPCSLLLWRFAGQYRGDCRFQIVDCSLRSRFSEADPAVVDTAEILQPATPIKHRCFGSYGRICPSHQFVSRIQ